MGPHLFGKENKAWMAIFFILWNIFGVAHHAMRGSGSVTTFNQEEEKFR